MPEVNSFLYSQYLAKLLFLVLSNNVVLAVNIAEFVSDCDCMANNSSGTVPCQCWAESSGNSRETLMSTTARFTSISAIAVSPDGVVNVADQVLLEYT